MYIVCTFPSISGVPFLSTLHVMFLLFSYWSDLPGSRRRSLKRLATAVAVKLRGRRPRCSAHLMRAWAPEGRGSLGCLLTCIRPAVPGARAMVSELWEGAEGPSEPRASSRLRLRLVWGLT